MSTKQTKRACWTVCFVFFASLFVCIQPAFVHPSRTREHDGCINDQGCGHTQAKLVHASRLTTRQFIAAAVGSAFGAWITPASAKERRRRLSEALQSGKPIVVKFSADWCPGCRELENAMRKLERAYSADVEFVSIDCSDFQPSVGVQWWIQQFQVRGLPHVAFIEADGQVPTALVGKVQENVLAKNVAALSSGRDLPYVMFDAFEGRKPVTPWQASEVAS
eukprot:TRINITY_DN36955_c0_g1_i1.p1 TRINITY_DN36955_c0_g1~~TRINITY_DN36955_c0_g1_i1.p1  ORF type:complete len:237 (-),score=16.27 TRINITY_DN36955_c0_g1_i1:117-779(-)